MGNLSIARKTGVILTILFFVGFVWCDAKGLTDNTKMARKMLANPSTEVMELSRNFDFFDGKNVITIPAETLVYKNGDQYIFNPRKGSVSDDAYEKFGVQPLKMAPRYSGALVFVIELESNNQPDLVPLGYQVENKK